MDLDEIERLLNLMREHDLVEIELEDPEHGTRLRLRKAAPAPVLNNPQVMAGGAGAPHPVLEPVRAPEGVQPPGTSEISAEEEADRAKLAEVPSPMVGTFYRSPSPEADSFVEVGEQIDVDSVICIIEAMKVMNVIKAEVAGEVVDILVQIGEAVEYGQPLFLIRTG